MDFDAYQPEAAFKLAMEFPKLTQFVLQKLEKNPPILEGLDDGKISVLILFMKLCNCMIGIVGWFQSEYMLPFFVSDTKAARIFLSLARLIPVKLIGHKKDSNKKTKHDIEIEEEEDDDPDNWRLSRQDIKDSFLLHVKVCST